MRRFAKRLGRALSGVALFLAALAGLAWWYIGQGPIPLDRLTPRLQAEIQRAVPGMTVRFGKLSASHDGFRRAVLVRVENVTLTHPLLSGTATVRDMSFLIPRGALVGDDPTPQQITLSDARARMDWTPEQVRKWLDGEESTPPRLKWLAGLDKVTVRNVQLDLRETSDGSSDDARDVLTIRLLKAERGLLLGNKEIQLKLDGSLAQSRGPAQLRVTATGKAVPGGQWEAKIRSAAIAPQRYVAYFAPLRALPTQVPEITATTDITATDQLRGETLVRLAPGKLAWQKYYAQPLDVQAFETRVDWSDRSALVRIRKMDMLVNGVRLGFQGTVNNETPERSVLTGAFETMTIGQLISLWPENAAVGGRAWIAQNIESGSVRDGKLTLAAATRSGADPKISLKFDFDRLKVHYRRPMPALTDASGAGILTNENLTLDVARGFINAVTVPKSRVIIGPFSSGIEYADVDLTLAGNLPDLLAILDSEPLGYISRYGLKPRDVTGAVSGNVKLKIPLLKSVSFDDVALFATARSVAARVPDVYAGKALDKADLDFVVTQDKLEARGSGSLNGNPLTLVWQEDFTGTSATPTRYDIKTQTNVSALAALGVDVQAIALGDFPASLVLQGRGGLISSGRFDADIFNTQLTVPPFGIVKATGVPGRATGQFSQQGRQVVFEKIQVTSAPVSATLSAHVPIDSGRSEFAISSFVYGSNRMRGTLAFGGTQPLQVTIEDGELDLRPELIAWRKAQNVKERQPPRSVMTASALSPPGALDILTRISGQLGRIRLLGNIDYHDVVLNAEMKGELLTAASVRGQLGEDAATQISVSSTTAGRKLRMTSDDAGLLARALDLYSNARGGLLTVDADFSGRDKLLTITGKAEMTDFRLVNAPALAKTLTIASLTGLTDTLRGRGIEFRTIEAPFTLKRGVIDIRKASAVGPGLGVTMEGQVSRATGQTNMRGTIVPSYGLNAAVGKIPLVGKMIVGGKHQGLIGFRYRITGTMSDPKIDVTKSTALAPGILRGLFKGKAAVIDPAFEEAATAGVQ